MNVSVIGVGYVGLATATVMAELGNDVVGADFDSDKIAKLKEGIMPIFEPGLKELVVRNMKEKRLRFTAHNKDAIEHAEVIFICVGTPPKKGGETDLKFVEAVTKEIATTMTSYKIIVHKSTVPVETGKRVKEILTQHVTPGIEFDVVSNPEFLREGTAIKDTMEPERIVIGTDGARAIEMMKNLYSPLEAPFIVTDIESAELIKHASNSFLAMKISYINAIARICEASGADVEKVAEGMGFDSRIGSSFLNAGIGYGGMCLPKDVRAFIKIAEKYDLDFSLLKATHDMNQDQIQHFIRKVKKRIPDLKNKRLGILGLSFKPNTDDMRYAPCIPIIEALLAEGAVIQAYDPEAMERSMELFPDIDYCTDPYEAAKGADALLLLTEWNSFKKLDLKRLGSVLKEMLIFDGRNIYDPATMKEAGFTYISMGRPEVK